jgi:hypothetical protein
MFQYSPYFNTFKVTFEAMTYSCWSITLVICFHLNLNCSLCACVYCFSVNTTNTTNNCFPVWLLQHVSTHINHHQANLETLNIFEFLLTVFCFESSICACFYYLILLFYCYCKPFIFFPPELRLQRTKKVEYMFMLSGFGQ